MTGLTIMINNLASNIINHTSVLNLRLYNNLAVTGNMPENEQVWTCSFQFEPMMFPIVRLQFYTKIKDESYKSHSTVWPFSSILYILIIMQCEIDVDAFET